MARPKKQHNINWIAEEAGVSVATVSNTLNNRSGVSEETRKKIQKIISGSVYERSYRNVNPPTITVLTDQISSWYMMESLSGIIEYTSSVGINMNTVIYRPDSEKPLIEQLRSSRCDGVIILAICIGKDDLADIRQMNVPAIMVDDISEDENIGYVNNNSYQGSFDLARHLISLGHREIAYLTYHVILPQQQNTLARIDGWRQAMLQTGVSREQTDSMLQTATYEEIPRVIETLVRRGDITALMVADDHMALAVMQACHNLGVKIPEDLSVTGFDDVFDAQYYFPALTTAKHSAKEIAGRAIRILDNVLSGRSDRLIREIVPVDLVVRKSTGPARNMQNNLMIKEK